MSSEVIRIPINWSDKQKLKYLAELNNRSMNQMINITIRLKFMEFNLVKQIKGKENEDNYRKI